MKIKTKEVAIDQVYKLEKWKHVNPKRPSLFFRGLMRTLGKSDLKQTHFTYQEIHMDRLLPKEPCLILMNHSSFIDLKIAAHIFRDRPYNIVCTSDGFIGKEKLMRNLGCIPTNKFVTDMSLVKDMVFATKKLKNSVLMFPEASYSFDGTATPLPSSIGKCIKLLKVPVVVVRTYGAFHRDPLYNNLQLRNVTVSADVEYVLSKEDIEEKSVKEINQIIKEKFSFDHFKWQQDNKIRVAEPFRADYLNRVLYKCPECLSEGNMEGKGTKVYCHTCKKTYELSEYGRMHAMQGETKISHIPEWYQWERECVRKELESGQYHLSVDVDICVMVDMKCLYKVGRGHLEHTLDGFHLTGCDGKIDYHQEPKSSYSLYADYYWYEIGDVICIGDQNILYYCFPKKCGDIVAKTRLATEELYKMKKKTALS